MVSRLFSFLLKALGWELVVDWPESSKYVLIVYPHTSNWDFLVGLFAKLALRLEAHYIAKHTLFRKPYGWFFRAFGGIPVDRRHKGSLAQQLAKRFDESDPFVLALAPEGTRSKTDHWKSGFYHIAREAQVPIAMAYFDYPKKRIYMGGAFYPGDDIGETYQHLREFFAGVRGKNPGQAGEIQARSL